VEGKLVCFKVVGRANFTSSTDFKAAVHRLLQRGFTCFVLDLTDCLLMDSTFLGVLSGLVLRFVNRRDGEPPASLELLNPNARILDLLESLGIAHLFRITQRPGSEMERLHPSEPIPASTNKTEVTRTCLEAHQTLMEINPNNIPKFKDVAQFLAEDLKRMEEADKATDGR
jgi:anti-anti-sigma regulatory factor